MAKRIMSLLIVVGILIISLAACSTPETETPPTAVVTATATTQAEVTTEPTEAALVKDEESNEVTATSLTYTIVDTNQSICYDDNNAISCPSESEAFYGQDAQYTGNVSSYTDNGDGTVTDNVTGLIWQQSADTNGDGDIDTSDKMSYANAVDYCDTLSFAGYDDWILPTIKQLYSLMDFTGVDPSGYEDTDTSGLIPFIDTDYFDFAYGDTDANERIIDSQYASSNLYVGDAYEDLLFGVNFADGRIKGYGLTLHGQDKTFTIACVRETTYGINDFSVNGDSTITDNATGLMWAQDDSGTNVPEGLNWEEALAYAEEMNAANYLGYSDWRLPDIKELQSIIDYDRSPDTTDSAAIDPVFNATAITNEAGETDYGFYWSGTTHANWTDEAGSAGAYVSFGRAMGYYDEEWTDVHGAGAQRSDPKSGDPDDYPTGNGPQGDAIRIYNFVRLVRGGNVSDTPQDELTNLEPQATFPVVEGNMDAQTSSTTARPGALGEQAHPDLAHAAQTLGITVQQIKDALGDPSQGPPDMAHAAQRLGVTEAELLEALGIESGGMPMPPSDLQG